MKKYIVLIALFSIILLIVGSVIAAGDVPIRKEGSEEEFSTTVGLLVKEQVGVLTTTKSTKKPVYYVGLSKYIVLLILILLTLIIIILIFMVHLLISIYKKCNKKKCHKKYRRKKSCDDYC